MNGKKHSVTGSSFSSDGMRAEILNPFVHKLELDNIYDKIKTAIFTVILLPFRVIVICYLIVTAWFLACVGLYGLSEEDLRARPMTGWRRKLRFSILSLMRLVPVVAGFHRVKIIGRENMPSDPREAPVIVIAPHSSFFDAIAIVCLGAPSVVAKADTARIPCIGPLKPLICFIGKMSYLAGGMAITVRGRQASRQEAPILVVAPHSSFLDSCIVYATKMSSVIVRKESMDNYVGKLINYTQPVYVVRDDPDSRQNTIKEIIERATSKEDWPQILIFPEGTCTNRSCLITFKPGGFYPGVPIQPVVIRYPNARDTVTWTWEGPGALKLMWLTLTQVHSSCEIEFLPVYRPSNAEKKDPKLYANNVRQVMAKALGIPVLDCTYSDCVVGARARRLGLRGLAAGPLRHLRGGDFSRELQIAGSGDVPGWVSREQFARALLVPETGPTMQIYDMFVQNETGLVYFPEYLLCAIFVALQHSPLTDLLYYAFMIFDTSSLGRLSLSEFEQMAKRCLGMCQEEANNIFRQIDAQEKGYVTYDEFLTFARKTSELSFIFTCETSNNKLKSQ